MGEVRAQSYGSYKSSYQESIDKDSKGMKEWTLVNSCIMTLDGTEMSLSRTSCAVRS